LRVLLAGQHRLELLVHDVAHLRQVHEAHALGVLGRRLAHHLQDRRLAGRVLVVEARLLGFLIGRDRDRQVAGDLVQASLDLASATGRRRRPQRPCIQSSLLPPKTQRLAPPGMVFCGAMAFIIGQLADAVVHAGLDDIAEAAGGFGQDAAFAGHEQLLGFGGASAVTEGAVLGEVGDRLEMLDEQRRVDRASHPATEAVLVGAIGTLFQAAKFSV
jgi:hypothetical protein